MISCPQHGDRWIIPDGQSCSKCKEQHSSERVGKIRPRKADRPLRHDHDAAVTLKASPNISPEEGAAFLKEVMNDPVRRAQLSLLVARPPGVSKERFNIAARAAGREPMLNANPNSIRFGLDSNRVEEQHKRKALPKMGVAERLRIKPTNLRNAKYGRNSAFWGEREWLIFVLKYSRGYVIRTDTGDESTVFPNIAATRAAIKQSGWEIIS